MLSKRISRTIEKRIPDCSRENNFVIDEDEEDGSNIVEETIVEESSEVNGGGYENGCEDGREML